MSGQKLGPCCQSGKIWSGTPTGKIESFGGIEAYVAVPEGDFDKTKAIIYCPDVFGHKLPNAQLLADTFAADTKKAVYVIDYLSGDAIPVEAMDKGTVDVNAWLAAHSFEKTTEILNKFIEALKAKGITSFATTGYCFGGRYSLYLSVQKISEAAVLNHPTLLQIPKDLEDIKASKVPVLFNTCEHDPLFNADSQKETDRIFANVTEAEGFRRDYYPGAGHGFVVRGNIEDPLVKEAKEKAVCATVDWFNKFF